MCVEKGINKTTTSKAHAAKFDGQMADIALRQVRILYPSCICGLMDEGLTWLPEKYLPPDSPLVEDPGVYRRREVITDIGTDKKTLGKIAASTELDKDVVRNALREMRGAGMVKVERHSWLAA